MIIVTDSSYPKLVKAEGTTMNDVSYLLKIKIAEDGRVFYGERQKEFEIRYNMDEYTKEEVRIDLARNYVATLLKRLGYEVYEAEKL